MLAKRIIPCLDVKDGRVVKGTNFQGLQDIADPVDLARFYNKSGADELVFYDITASFAGRKLFADTLTAVASEVFIPLTVGGGINGIEDFDRVLKCGKYGNQCVVLSIDAKRVDGRFEVFSKGGRVPTGIDAVEWAYRGQEEGAGEIVLNSIDTDGVRGGFDLEMLSAVCDKVHIPVIASGGAGCAEHFAELFRKVEGVDAGLAAGIFHTGIVDIKQLKKYLADQGVPMRIN